MNGSKREKIKRSKSTWDEIALKSLAAHLKEGRDQSLIKSLAKSSTALAQPLNLRPTWSDGSGFHGTHIGFPYMLKFLMAEVNDSLPCREGVGDGCMSSTSSEESESKDSLSLLQVISLPSWDSTNPKLHTRWTLSITHLPITKVFKGSLYEMSTHYCGNFIVQTLISQARNEDHVELIWKELGSRFKDLFGMGKWGVVASLLAACQKL
ncbi:pumilio homolog 23 [Tanacetum coccineum]